MRFVHRIGLRARRDQMQILAALGVKLPKGIVLPGGGDPLLAFDVDERHPSWPKLRDLFQEWGASDFPRTEFSSREIEVADCLEIGAWHHGHPQPDEGDFGYLRATYDLADWCEQCGTGRRQKAPFQMKGEPRWGRNGILQLIWIYDELFVRPDVWASVFEPVGIAHRPVTNTNGTELKTVVQLVVEREVAVVTEGLAGERCGRCARTKYSPAIRGPFPALRGELPGAMAKTTEYFGSGGQSDRRVIIAQGLARSLVSKGVRGAFLRPVAPSGL